MVFDYNFDTLFRSYFLIGHVSDTKTQTLTAHAITIGYTRRTSSIMCPGHRGCIYNQLKILEIEYRRAYPGATTGFLNSLERRGPGCKRVN